MQFPKHSFVTFFEVKSAFDKVVRLRLLQRMVDYEFPPYLIQVVHSFLSHRLCRISSVVYYHRHGVPQGSVLVPILLQILVCIVLLAEIPADLMLFLRTICTSLSQSISMMVESVVLRLTLP